MRIRQHIGNVDIHIDTSRIDNNIREAQKLLNLAIVGDCEQFVPFQQGALRGSAWFPDGVYGGVIEYNTPYAHLLYVGKVYGPNIPKIDETTGEVIGWWSPPKKHPTGNEIKYHEPGTGKEWFETGKQRYGQSWIDLVKRTAGKE